MKATRKLLAALLAVPTLITLFTGCAKNGNDPVTSDSAKTDVTTSHAETEPEFPAADYGKTKFTVYGRGDGEASYPGLYIDTEDSSDTMGHKTRERNSIVETKYNIDIEFTTDPNPYKNVSNFIDSGDSEFDLILDRRSTLNSLAQSGYLKDFNTLEHVDFTKPWWDANCARDYEVAGKLFFMANDISVSNLAGTRFLYFNKALIEKNQLESPYDLVHQNKWTIDKMLEMVKAVNVDNGDGVWNGQDVYGFLAETGSANGTVIHMLVGCGIKYTEKAEDGTIVCNAYNEKTLAVVEKIYDVFENQTCTLTYQKCAEGADMSGFANKYNYGRSLFASDHFLFVQNGMSISDQFKEMNPGFGIAPNPKYNEDQESYYHKMDKYALIWAIPNFKDLDTERLGIVMEYWAYQSSRTVMPAYYEVVIKFRRATDPNAHEMLDIIKGSIRYDISELFTSTITDVIWNGYASGNLASRWAQSKDAINVSIDAFYNKIKDLG